MDAPLGRRPVLRVMDAPGDERAAAQPRSAPTGPPPEFGGAGSAPGLTPAAPAPAAAGAAPGPVPEDPPPAVTAAGAAQPVGADATPELTAAVAAAQRGDEGAFAAVYRDVHPRLLRYLRVLVGADADDVASEAWLQIARDLPTFAGTGDGFRGWAATIARHRALDHLRRERRRPRPAVPIESVPDSPGGEDTEAMAMDTIATDEAIALIARLPREQAEAVLLRAVVGLDAAAAAAVLGKRPGAVRTAAHRGLRRLAQMLNEMDDPPAGGERESR